MKKKLVVSLCIVAAAGALIAQTTPVRANPLPSTAGSPLPKFGEPDQQWLLAAGKSASGMGDIIGSALNTAFLTTSAAVAGATTIPGSNDAYEVAGASIAVATGQTDLISSVSSDSSGSGGTTVRSGAAAANPVYDHFGILQNPGGPVSQPGPGDLPAGQIEKIGASRLD